MKYTVYEKKKVLLFRFVSVCAILWLTILSGGIYGQDRVELLISNSQIPKNSYKSWSLFLISDPDWILAEGNDQLKDLYEQFIRFGDVIGREHLAVWFWSIDPRVNDLYRAVDIMRARAFCLKLKLPPNEGPYVIITTEYPGAGALVSYPQTFPDSLNKFQVIKLNGADASETMRLLADLADQLRFTGLRDLDSESEDFWRTLFVTTRDILVGFTDKITVKIKAPGIEAEIKP